MQQGSLLKMARSSKPSNPSQTGNNSTRMRNPPVIPLSPTNRPMASNIGPSTSKQSDNKDPYSKFIVLEASDDDKLLSKLNPFEVKKAFTACVGKVANVKKLRSGVLLAEVQNEQQVSDLLKLDTFAACPVKVSTHRSMNSSKGVIRSYELAQVSREDLLEGLASQGVTGAIHIQTRNGTKQPSPVIILTFSTRTLPDYITACYQNIAVEQYTPSPLRCFSCQKLGHHKNACKGTKMCATCGLAEHGRGHVTDFHSMWVTTQPLTSHVRPGSLNNRSARSKQQQRMCRMQRPRNEFKQTKLKSLACCTPQL